MKCKYFTRHMMCSLHLIVFVIKHNYL